MEICFVFSLLTIPLQIPSLPLPTHHCSIPYFISASSLCSLSTSSNNVCLCPMVFLTSSDSLGYKYHTTRLNLFADFLLHQLQPDVHGELRHNHPCSLIPLVPLVGCQSLSFKILFSFLSLLTFCCIHSSLMSTESCGIIILAH